MGYIYYQEGDWLAVPLPDNSGYGVCLVAYCDKVNGDIYGFFFNEVVKSIPISIDLDKYTHEDIIIIMNIIGLSEEVNRWQVIAHSDNWSHSRWPIPPTGTYPWLHWHDEDSFFTTVYEKELTETDTRQYIVGMNKLLRQSLENNESICKVFSKKFPNESSYSYIAAETELQESLRLLNSRQRYIIAFDFSRVIPLQNNYRYWIDMVGQQVVISVLKYPRQKRHSAMLQKTIKSIDHEFHSTYTLMPGMNYDGAVLHDRFILLYWHGIDAAAIVKEITPRLITIPYIDGSYIVKYLQPPGILQERENLPVSIAKCKINDINHFTAPEETACIHPMELKMFWRHIASVKHSASCDCMEQVDMLARRLANQPTHDIIAFDRRLDELRAQAYRWNLWSAASLINGECSDDGFEYFRGWLILQGEIVFSRALEDPDSLTTVITPGELAECESLLYVAKEAYVEKTGEEMPQPPFTHSIGPKEPSGELWTSENLPNHLPRLWKAMTQYHPHSPIIPR